MAVKTIAFDREAREAIRTGLRTLARAVKVTLGPRGRNVMIQRGLGGPLVTKDGVTVAKEMELPGTLENIGAQLVREVAQKTADGAGDGTTTATVLAEAIFERGFQAVNEGVQPVQLKRGMEAALAKVLAKLKTLSRPVKGEQEIEHVATVAANGDAEIGGVMARAIQRVGKDGVITIDSGKTLDTRLEFAEGMAFDKGYLSPHYINDVEQLACVLEDPIILLYDGKLSSAAELIPLLEQVLSARRPLVLMAEEIEGEALAVLVVNHMRGTLPNLCVKTPGYGDARKAMLEDIACMVGARVVSKETGLDLEKVTIKDLGQAGKVVARRDETTIIDGKGDPSRVKGRLTQLKNELAATTSIYDKEKLEQRVAKLSGGVARILVGAATEAEMKEKKARVDDALHATRAAVQEGVVAGGGVALLRCAAAVDELKLEGDVAIGARIVKEALQAPLRQIARNAGENPSVVAERVLREKDPSFGFNAATLEYGDLVAQGVIDPTKVARCALENAVSVATLLLTTEALVGEAKITDPHHPDYRGDAL